MNMLLYGICSYDYAQFLLCSLVIMFSHRELLCFHIGILLCFHIGMSLYTGILIVVTSTCILRLCVLPAMGCYREHNGLE